MFFGTEIDLGRLIICILVGSIISYIVIVLADIRAIVRFMIERQDSHLITMYDLKDIAYFNGKQAEEFNSMLDNAFEEDMCLSDIEPSCQKCLREMIQNVRDMKC